MRLLVERFDLGCRDLVFIMVAKMRADVIDYRRNLRLAEHRRRTPESDGMSGAKGWHVASSHQNRQRHVLARCQCRVLGERRIMTRADRTGCILHVATPTNMLVYLLAIRCIDRRRVQNASGMGERRRLHEHRSRQT